jgi:hypothetical protein
MTDDEIEAVARGIWLQINWAKSARWEGIPENEKALPRMQAICAIHALDAVRAGRPDTYDQSMSALELARRFPHPDPNRQRVIIEAFSKSVGPRLVYSADEERRVETTAEAHAQPAPSLRQRGPGDPAANDRAAPP